MVGLLSLVLLLSRMYCTQIHLASLVGTLPSIASTYTTSELQRTLATSGLFEFEGVM